MAKKMKVIDYKELDDGGAIVTFEMDEETRGMVMAVGLYTLIKEGVQDHPSNPDQGDEIDTILS